MMLDYYGDDAALPDSKHNQQYCFANQQRGKQEDTHLERIQISRAISGGQ